MKWIAFTLALYSCGSAMEASNIETGCDGSVAANADSATTAPLDAGFALDAGIALDSGHGDAAVVVSPNAFYVAPSGNDDNDGSLAAPFKTLEKARSAAAGDANKKTVYVRAGTWNDVSLTLTQADNSETWSYYPPDGYNKAILDGGASSSSTGGNVLTIDGASKVTIDGVMIRNFQQYGIGIHGGAGDSVAGFPNTVPSIDGNTIVNNIIDTGYTNKNKNWAGGGIWGTGSDTHLTIANNVIQNQFGSGIRIAKTAGSLTAVNTNYTFNGLVIKNNVVLNTDITSGDNGTIYLEDLNSVGNDVVITNNFIRDYQEDPSKETNGVNLYRGVAIYLDSGTCGVKMIGNVIAATKNADKLPGQTGGVNAWFNGGGHDNVFSGNIVDMGMSALYVPVAYDDQLNSATNNVIEQNLFLGKWSGNQMSSGFGTGPATFFFDSNDFPLSHYPTVTNNLYFNYGGGQILSTSNVAHSGDSAPVTKVDPKISGSTYTIASDSPAYGAPLRFAKIVGGWGPPGYSIAATGTAPSYTP